MDASSSVTVGEEERAAGTNGDGSGGDGVYRDVNGNGRLDGDDLVIYFDNVDSDTVQGNVDAFDYNENGRIDFDDVVTLFESLTEIQARQALLPGVRESVRLSISEDERSESSGERSEP